MSRTVCQEIISDMVCALPTAPRRGWLLRGTPQDPAPARRGEERRGAEPCEQHGRCWWGWRPRGSPRVGAEALRKQRKRGAGPERCLPRDTAGTGGKALGTQRGWGLGRGHFQIAFCAEQPDKPRHFRTCHLTDFIFF